MQYRVGMIGHFGIDKDLSNGQTIKTKSVAGILSGRLGSENLLLVDTHGGLASIGKLLLGSLRAVRRCQNVIILPAQNGIRVIGPMLWFFNLFFHRKLHYSVIGGWLVSLLETRPCLRYVLKHFDGIYVETQIMKHGLEKMGFKNVYLMPNFKDLTPLREETLAWEDRLPRRFCTFSRVMEEKGIADAVKAVKDVNEHYGQTVCTLDIYGQVDPDQTAWFEELSATFTDAIRYGGVIPYDKSVDVIKEYCALLFPTKFYTEGIPGTIIDAYAAGVPVIAAQWESFGDIVEHGMTGIGYPFAENERLSDILMELVEHPGQLLKMKKHCLKKAEDYLPENVINILLENLA